VPKHSKKIRKLQKEQLNNRKWRNSRQQPKLYVFNWITASPFLNNLLQDFATEFYGALPLNRSQSRPRLERVQISSLSSRDGETVLLRARVQTSRAQGNKMVFLNLRQRIDSVQALLTVTPEKVSKQMVKWAAGLADESIVLIQGVVRKTPEPIKSATVSDVEIHVTQVRVSNTSRDIVADNPPGSSYLWCRRTTALLSRGRVSS
jgi:hypothetical protein